MVIEWLRFLVKPELREQFVQQDEDIWTAALARYPGFLGKDVWISPDNLSEVVCVIRWSSLEQWQSIPPEELRAVEARFLQVMGGSYEMIESNRYQVRKFMHCSS